MGERRYAVRSALDMKKRVIGTLVVTDGIATQFSSETAPALFRDSIVRKHTLGVLMDHYRNHVFTQEGEFDERPEGADRGTEEESKREPVGEDAGTG